MIADVVEARPDVKTPEAEAPEVELRRRRYSVAEYMRMAEAELFAESERARRIEVLPRAATGRLSYSHLLCAG